MRFVEIQPMLWRLPQLAPMCRRFSYQGYDANTRSSYLKSSSGRLPYGSSLRSVKIKDLAFHRACSVTNGNEVKDSPSPMSDFTLLGALVSEHCNIARCSINHILIINRRILINVIYFSIVLMLIIRSSASVK
jgi:hypothetical protein